MVGDSTFVGEGRQKIVRGLVAMFERTMDCRRPSIGVLIGPPGSGKTRLVQEFFRRLPRDGSDGAYWPPHLVDEGDWQECRKDLQPEGDTRAGTPPWLWWTVECHRQGETFVQSLFNDRPALDRQLNAVVRRRVLRVLSEGLGWVDYALSLLSITLLALSLTSMGARLVGSMISWIDLAVLFTGLGVLVWTPIRRRRVIRDAWRALRGRKQTDWQDNDKYGRRNDIEHLADTITNASRRLPVIIIIDDAHVADETLIEFLNELLQRANARVLIIACAWPMTKAHDLPFATWLERTGKVNDHRLMLIDLAADAPMADSDLMTIIRAELTRQGFNADTVDEPTYRMLIGKSEGNPLAAIAQLQTEECASLLAAGRLGPREAESLPSGLRSIIEAYWRNLPENVRSVLALASLLGRDFPDAPVVQSVDGQGRGPGRVLLDQADETYRVIRSPTVSLRRFVDKLYLKEARNDADDPGIIPVEVLKALAEAIERAVGQEVVRSRSSSAQEVILAAHVQFARDGLIADRRGATRSALLLGDHHAQRFAFLNALQSAHHADELDPRDDDELTLEHRTARVRWHLAAGQADQALQRAHDVVDFAAGRFAPTSTQTVEARLLYGEVGIAAGRHLEMLEHLRSTLRAARSVVHAPPLILNRLETQVAECLSRSGRFGEAGDILTALARRLREEDAEPLEVAKASFAALKIRLRSGFHPEVVAALRGEIRRSDALLAPDHPQSLRGRLLLVESLMTYRQSDALAEARRVVRHAEKFRPSGHVDVIRASIRESETLRVMGDRGDFRDHAVRVHELAEQSLGTTNPNTARALGVVVDALIDDARQHQSEGGAERWSHAEETCLRLLDLCRSAYGFDNADTLMVERRLALIYGGTGRPDEGLALTADLLERTMKIRGDEHPDSLRTRGIQLALHGAAIARDPSVVTKRAELIADCHRIMGDGHPMCSELGERA